MRKASILCGILFLSAIVSVPSAKAAQPKVLFDFGKEFPLSSVGTQDASVSLSDSGALRIATGHANKWPGITLKAPQGKWDLSAYSCLTADIRNCGNQSVTVNCRVDNPHADGSNNCVTGTIMLEAGRTDRLVVMLYPTPWVLSEPVEIIGMRGWPKAAGKLDASNVVQLLFFVSDPSTGHLFEADNITVADGLKRIDAKKLFPMIDRFGQFIHDDWPGKIHSVSDLQQTLHTELADISAHTSPADRNKYGGWTKGPQLEATGYFRVQKYKDKWWLVDPEGRLFWSHGIDCVRAGNSTPITDRERYYAFLPQDGSPLARFYGSGNWAPHGYYNEHSPYKTYDFNSADLLQKYGSDWNDAFARMAHRRIRSWGMNTIANWSDSDIYLMRQTPYTGNLSFDSRKIEGSEGYWGRFSDVFDDGFRTAIRQAVAREKGRSLGDPWCIGYFVHNELGWGDEVSLAIGALKSPPDQPAKLVFIADLKAKYKTIDRLNSIWGTNHKSWDDLANSTEAPDRKKAWDDLTAFYTKIAETYFAVIRDEIKAAAPNQMYFGCRFAWVNDRAARAAAKYCDVVCYNRYSYSVADHRLPDNIDMPIIVGEFHFGALDRGMFHTGLKATIDQDDRAAKYTSYVEGALRNPYIVGTHWFQFTSQATTGRGDGENYQIGFLDGCDTPYSEIIAASRTIGDEMYEYRLR
jgi:hypothetical protein